MTLRLTWLPIGHRSDQLRPTSRVVLRMGADDTGNSAVFRVPADVFLVHFPGTIDAVQDPKRNRQLRADTWRALETLQRDGVATRIGVSNWTRRHLKETLASCQIKPELLQVEFHPRLQQSALLADAADAGIKVMAACPLATGADALLADPLLARVATRYGRTPAQVALRWAVQRGVLPIPKATSAARLRENLGALDFSLDGGPSGSSDAESATSADAPAASPLLSSPLPRIPGSFTDLAGGSPSARPASRRTSPVSPKEYR